MKKVVAYLKAVGVMVLGFGVTTGVGYLTTPAEVLKEGSFANLAPWFLFGAFSLLAAVALMLFLWLSVTHLAQWFLDTDS